MNFMANPLMLSAIMLNALRNGLSVSDGNTTTNSETPKAQEARDQRRYRERQERKARNKQARMERENG